MGDTTSDNILKDFKKVRSLIESVIIEKFVLGL